MSDVRLVVLCLLDTALDRWRWWRRLRGGCWERWLIGAPVGSEIWICRPSPSLPPPGLGLLLIEAEDHRAS